MLIMQINSYQNVNYMKPTLHTRRTFNHHYLVALFFSIALLTQMGCKSSTKETDEAAVDTEEENIQPNPYEDAVVEVQVFKVDSLDHNGIRGWGYNIKLNGSLYIHQPNVPAVMGNNGFNSEAAAKKAGDFVAYKIRKNIIPPSVTPEELDSLGVLQE